MAITACRSCKAMYWRFRKDHPPSGFCSTACAQAKRVKDADPPVPSEVLWQMRTHRLDIHKSTSILEWFECETCSDLEKLYAKSLQFHYDQITTVIAETARQREDNK